MKLCWFLVFVTLLQPNTSVIARAQAEVRLLFLLAYATRSFCDRRDIVNFDRIYVICLRCKNKPHSRLLLLVMRAYSEA